MTKQIIFIGLKTLPALLVFGLGVVSYASDSGCGLGSVVIQKNSKILQLFSMTTNDTLFTQGFGITSGTSGCTASGLVMNDKAIEYFAENNQSDLSREMAQGQGEKLLALAALYGCRGEDQKAFAKMTQANYEHIFPTAETKAPEMVQNLKREASGHPEIGTCKI